MVLHNSPHVLMHTLVLVTCVIHHNLLGSSIRTCPKLWWRAKGWSDTDGCSLWAPTAAGKQANFSLGSICRQVYEHLQTVLGRRACWHVLRNLYALFVHDCKSIQCDIICALKVRGRRQHFACLRIRAKVVYVYYAFRNIAWWRRICTFGVSLFSPPLAVSCLAMILGELQLLLVVYYIRTGLSRDVFCLDVAMWPEGRGRGWYFPLFAPYRVINGVKDMDSFRETFNLSHGNESCSGDVQEGAVLV